MNQATTDRLIQQTDLYGAQNYKPLPVVLVKGEGCWLEDGEGKRYLDMLSAYSALNQGHLHPRIVGAMKAQLDRLSLTSRAFYHDQLGPLNEKLAKLCGLDTVLLMNSGAEAVETALKIARKWGHKIKGIAADRGEIIACDNNFHGRTLGIISFSTHAQYKEDFGPLLPGFRTIPFGDTDALEEAITPETIAFLVEPIQGEGGVIVPPEGYLRRVREICDRHRVLMMVDEIQVGLGRTGKLFCYEHDEIKPDVVILGKALGGGLYPVSAVVSKQSVLGLFRPGDHGSTFGGNPLACAVALEALDVLLDLDLSTRAAEQGAFFMDSLRAMKSPHVKEVRGRGLLLGVELHPEAGPARDFCLALMKKGILAKDTQAHVIRFAPPLIIERGEIEWALERIQAVLSAALPKRDAA